MMLNFLLVKLSCLVLASRMSWVTAKKKKRIDLRIWRHPTKAKQAKLVFPFHRKIIFSELLLLGEYVGAKEEDSQNKTPNYSLTRPSRKLVKSSERGGRIPLLCYQVRNAFFKYYRECGKLAFQIVIIFIDFKN